MNENEIVFKVLNLIVDAFEKFKNSQILFSFWDALQRVWMAGGTLGIPENYAQTIFTNHLKGCPGSTFMTSSVLEHVKNLFVDHGDAWEEFTPAQDVAFPGCRYFRANIQNIGNLGAERIEDVMKRLNPKTFAEVRESHSGNLELVLRTSDYSKPITNTVTLIMEKMGSKNLLSTIHPGEPLPRGDVSKEELDHKGIKLEPLDLIQLSRAAELGFRVVKFV